MALVAKRRLTETWREALARLGGVRAAALLVAFEAGQARGLEEHAAAYRALEGAGLLERVVLPGDPADRARQSET
jgi:hypothetical protein